MEQTHKCWQLKSRKAAVTAAMKFWVVDVYININHKPSTVEETCSDLEQQRLTGIYKVQRWLPDFQQACDLIGYEQPL